MNRFTLVAAIALAGLEVISTQYAIAQGSDAYVQRVTAPFPPQLDMRAPIEPTAFPSANQIRMLYELRLTNFGTTPLLLQRIEVLDAGTLQTIGTFEAGQLDSILQPVGTQTSRGALSRQIAPGGTVIVFVSIALNHGATLPNTLVHRVIAADITAEGAMIGTHNTKLQTLGPPVEGANWLASDGPSNDQDNHHRRGIFVVGGRAVISRRFAIDWMQIKNGASFSGDSHDRRAYYAYGKPILAVADAKVIAAKDGLPENEPGHDGDFHPAVPITMETVGGNTITLDLGHGQFAHYFHMQPGSLRVKAGDRVRRGQILARVGDSGDAREPHLHFEITTSPEAMAGEGLPYVIDRYRITAATDGVTGPRTNELPVDNNVIDFGEDRTK